MGFLLGFLTAIGVMVLILGGWRSPQIRSFPTRHPAKTRKLQAIQSYKEVDPLLRQRLLTLLDGDEAAAERLVARQRFGKEGQYSESYCWWLAIRDREQSHLSDAVPKDRP